MLELDADVQLMRGVVNHLDEKKHRILFVGLAQNFNTALARLSALLTGALEPGRYGKGIVDFARGMLECTSELEIPETAIEPALLKDGETPFGALAIAVAAYNDSVDVLEAAYEKDLRGENKEAEEEPGATHEKEPGATYEAYLETPPTKTAASIDEEATRGALMLKVFGAR
ncbi:Hypothetical protein POVN_LOCUS227 [uncultured virus]|nr:Hypothetical protein POVN_LOCUS227 [uncultured virus]